MVLQVFSEIKTSKVLLFRALQALISRKKEQLSHVERRLNS